MRIQLIMGCIAAFLFASLAFVVMLFIATFGLMPVGLSLVLAHAAAIGLPIFLILWRMQWINAFSCSAAGFIVAALAGAVRNWPWQSSSAAMRTNVSVGGVPTYIDGVPTMAAWLELARDLGFLGFFGAIAGFIFWFVLVMSGDAG